MGKHFLRLLLHIVNLINFANFGNCTQLLRSKFLSCSAYSNFVLCGRISVGSLEMGLLNKMVYLFAILFIYFKITYLFLSALGFRFCAWAFSSCGKWELLFVAVHGLLIAVASLVVEHRL